MSFIKLIQLGLLSIMFVGLSGISIDAQSRRDRDRARTLQTEADRAYGAKDYRTAADKYGESVKLVPNNSMAHYKKGFAHMNLKEYEPAISSFNTALIQGFSPVEVYRVRGYVYFEQKDFDAALAEYKKGIEAAPNDQSFLRGVGEAYLAKKSYREAIQAFEKLIAVAPTDADAYYNLANAHFAVGNSGDQERYAREALKRGTRFPAETHYLLGDACRKERNPVCAIDSYQRAINSQPTLYQAYPNLADVYRSENRFNDAIDTLKNGLKVFPNDGNFYTDLGWYYSLADRPAEAVEAAKAGVIILPNQYMAYTNLCRAYNETKDYNLAIAACNNALRLKPGDGETNFYLGRALNLTGKTTEATRYYREAVKGLEEFVAQNPTYSDSWYLLGNAYFADNQRDKAANAYAKCLELSPKFVKARFNLGIIYTRMNNRAGATEQFNLLSTLDPKLAATLKQEIDAM